MRKRLLPIAFVGSCALFIFGCTKLDTTTLGQDLIPEIDNIHTFGDTIYVGMTSSQNYFSPDTTKVFYNESHALGHMSDPLFGTTDASIYLQLKPSFYPFYFGSAGDTTKTAGTTLPPDIVGVDSMFLCLSYSSYYGDTLTPIDLEVRQLYDNKFRDSAVIERDVNYQPTSLGTLLGSTTVTIPQLKNQVKFAHDKDSSTNQIRIKITDASFISQLYNSDSADLGAFHNDSLFRNAYNGFAITQKSGGSGNALLYISLTDANTRLEVHFRKRRNNINDTTYTNFSLYPTLSVYGQPSSTANGIVRSRTGTPSVSNDPNYVYLQTSPGSYSNILIPALSGRPNQIIHRAALLIESVPDVTNPGTDKIFTAPNYLYLDLKDTSVTDRWKPVYKDLNATSPYDPDQAGGYPIFPLSGVDPTSFGGNVKYKTDNAGNDVAYYDINITRYVQQIVTKQTPNYPMRLWAPYNFYYPQYSAQPIPYYNSIAGGRVRLASTLHPDSTKRLRLVIIYSKIQ